jgi:predicted transcriptional regulator of viral defense system
MDAITEIFETHGNVVRTADLTASKLYYADIQELLNRGVIKKLKRGYYQLTRQENMSEANIVQRFLPDSIFCLETALFYYGYSDCAPAIWHVAVNKNIQKSRMKMDYPKIKPYFVQPHLLDVGLTDGEIDGCKVRIYDRERTICDCLRRMGKMDRKTINKALRSYICDTAKNISNLLRYAGQLRVQKKVKDMIEVWL